MPSLTRNEQGMTLVEMLVAIGIISVGLVALSSAIPLAAYGIREGSQLSTATFLANQRMEQVRNARWKACPPPGVDELATFTSLDENPLPAPYADYRREVRITTVRAPVGCNTGPGADELDVTNPLGLRQVTVTVRYRPMTGVGVAPAGTTKSTVVTMFIAQRAE